MSHVICGCLASAAPFFAFFMASILTYFKFSTTKANTAAFFTIDYSKSMGEYAGNIPSGFNQYVPSPSRDTTPEFKNSIQAQKQRLNPDGPTESEAMEQRFHKLQ